jgi:hypothetical protein
MLKARLAVQLAWQQQHSQLHSRHGFRAHQLDSCTRQQAAELPLIKKMFNKNSLLDGRLARIPSLFLFKGRLGRKIVFFSFNF